MMDDRDIEVSGATLRCATYGEPGAAMAVLLVHGLTSNSRAWAMVGPLLASHGFFVIAPDLRGRGHSSKPDHGYGIPLHADDLLSLCDAFGVPSVHVVGHSLGAQIGLYLAAVHSERVDRLVLLDAGGILPADAAQAIAASLTRLDTMYPSLDAYLNAMEGLPIHPWQEFWEQYYRYDAHVREDGMVTSRVPRRAIDEEIRAMGTLRLEALSAFVRAPTLIVRATVGMLGPERGLILPPQEAERMVTTIAGSRVVALPGTNHYTILCDRNLGPEILAFLRKESATPMVPST